MPKPTPDVRSRARKNKERPPPAEKRSEKAQLGQDQIQPSLELHLSQLEYASLIRPLLDESDPTYIFKHTLTQETAYDAMLKTKRAELHRQVAEAIEKLSPDQLEQNAAVLALHYERGGRDDLAFVYAALAGDVAWRAYAHNEALAHYDRAIAIASCLDSNLFNTRMREVFAKRGRVFEVVGNRAAAIENYNAMIAFAQRAGDAAMEADALNHLVTIQAVTTGSTTPEIDALLDRALGLARQTGDQNLIGRTLWNMGLTRRFSDMTRAIEYFQQALDLARAADLSELAGFALTELIVQNQMLGRWDLALDYAHQALEEFRKLDNQPMVADSLANSAAILYRRGETSQAHAAALEGERMSRAIENVWATVFNAQTRLNIEFDAGEIERVIADGQAHLASARQAGFPGFIGFALENLARVNVELGELERAQTLADECADTLEKMHAPIWYILGRGVKAGVLIRRGLLEQAHNILDPLWQAGDAPVSSIFGFQKAGPAIAELALVEKRLDFGLSFCSWLLSHYEKSQAWRLAADIYFLRGVHYHARGDLELAERDLTLAREIAERAQYKLLLWQVDAALAKIYAQREETERAQNAHQRAAELIRTLAAKFSDGALRESFLRRTDVAEVLNFYGA